MNKYQINSIYLIIFLVIGLFLGHSIGQTEVTTTKAKIELEFDTTTDCNSEMIRLLYQIYRDSKNFKEIGPPFYERTIIEFKNKGFENPVAEIIADLKSKPELIPISGVLGGTVFFEHIRIISNNRAVASFEDGHIGGIGLYSYEAISPDEINWKLVFSSCGEPNFHEKWYK